MPAPRKKVARRYLALWFPYLATDRLARLERGKHWRIKSDDEAPRLLIASVKSAQRIVAVNQAAEALSLRSGQTLADARAQYPDLDAIEDDPRANSALLETIADWANRYTPLVALDREASAFDKSPLSSRLFKHGLIFDITGCAHLFTSLSDPTKDAEAVMVADIKQKLNAQGFMVQTGLASTVGTAWAVSRFANGKIIKAGQEKPTLNAMPIAALRLAPTIEEAMQRVGLKRIEQIIDLPRAPLANRFGLDLIRNINRALGEEEESISPRLPVPSLMAERRFHEPISQPADIEATLHKLAQTLVVTLETRGEGARVVEAALFQSDGGLTRAQISTAKSLTNPDAIVTLFRERLDESLERFSTRRLTEADGFDVVRLSILLSEPHKAEQTSFHRDEANTLNADLAHLIDKLGVRLGVENIIRLSSGDSHQPEETTTRQRAVDGASNTQAWPSPYKDQPITRPIRLFDQPEEVEAIAAIPEGPPLRFRWRRMLYTVKCVEGPERISAPWWRDKGIKPRFTRDYYRIEDESGRRFWLYRDGLYGEERADPKWYVHGLFA
ncbi:MAG: DUF6504 family protein [Hyphomicrobiales bacterium]